MRRKTFLKSIDKIAGIVFAIWLFGLLFFWVLADSVALPSQDQTTDAVIVFTGGPDRVNIGLNLLAANKTKTVFISGVGENVVLNDILTHWPDFDPDAPPCCITLGYEAKDTAGNASETIKWLQDENIQSIRLVTAHYHMPRARLALQRKRPNMHIIYHPVRSRKERGNYWRTSRIWIGEYNKTLVNLVKGAL